MSFDAIRPLALSLLFLSPGETRAIDGEKDAVIQWSPATWTPAVPTENRAWFLSVAPGSADVGTGSAVTLESGGDTFEAKVLHFNPSHRLCLIEAKTPVEGLADVEMVTFPLPEAGVKLHCWKPDSKSPSTVAGKEYSVRGEPLSSPLLKVRVADADEFCHPGTPLVCGNGRLFGILTEVVSPTEGEAFAVPASCLRKLLTEFAKYERTGKVWVGLIFEDRAQTPEIVEVRMGSPAEAAGLKPGDVVLSVAGHGVENLDHLTQTIHLLIAGETVDVEVLRGLKRVQLELTPEFADPTVAELQQ